MNYYQNIADALNFYQKIGYQYIDAPWIVSKKAIKATVPNGVNQTKYKIDKKILVGSAEQSFVQMMVNNELPLGKYCACTPCFRDEDVINEFTKEYFMKVELIWLTKERPHTTQLDSLLDDAREFMSMSLDTNVIATDSGFDIVDAETKIELGSYGTRTYNHFNWIYGTGLAEPRFSTVLNKKPMVI